MTASNMRAMPAAKPEPAVTFDLVALLALAGILYLWWPLHAPLLDRDEPRYAAAARTMLETRDWVVPQFNGAPRYQKPVLAYWLMAGSMAAFGASEWSARLPSALAALGTLAVVHLTVRRRCGRRAAWVASMVFATSPLVVLWARAAATDSVLTLLVSGTILTGWRATEVEGRQSRRWYTASAACAGLAMLTKGPTAPLLSALVLVINLARRHGLVRQLRVVPWGTVLPVFLAIGVPWYIAAYLRGGARFLEVLGEEHVGRLVAGAGGPHEPQFWGRLVVPGAMIVGLAPWTPLALAGAFTRTPDEDRAALRELARAWFWCTLVVFSASKGQWPSYALLLAPAAAMLAGDWAEAALADRDSEGTGRAVVAGTVVLGLGIAVLLAAAPYASGAAPPAYRYALSAPMLSVLLPSSAAVLLLALAAFVAAWAGRARGTSLAALGTGWGVTIVAFSVVAAPSIMTELSRPQVEVARYIAAHPDLPALTYGPREPTIVYYSERPVPLLKKDDPAFQSSLRHALATTGEALVVTDHEGATALASLYDTRIALDAGRMLVLRVRARP